MISLYKRWVFWEMQISQNTFLGHFLATVNVSFILNYSFALCINKHTHLHSAWGRGDPVLSLEWNLHTQTQVCTSRSALWVWTLETLSIPMQESILLPTPKWLYISFRGKPSLGVEVHFLLAKPILTRNKIPGQLLLSITPERSKEQSPNYPCAYK